MMDVQRSSPDGRVEPEAYAGRKILPLPLILEKGEQMIYTLLKDSAH